MSSSGVSPMSLVFDDPTESDLDTILRAFPFAATCQLISGLTGSSRPETIYKGANSLAKKASGGLNRSYAWASVSKLVSSLAVLIAIDRYMLELDTPAGPPGATVKHLLAHASGVAMDSDAVKAEVGTRRIYSNRGIELAALATEEATGIDFNEWVDTTVLQPLGMSHAYLWDSPAWGMRGTIGDLAILGTELLEQTLLSDDLDQQASHIVFPGLPGLLPGYGFQRNNAWGLGREIRATKDPHWTSPEAPPTTFGHFGQSGSFLWVDRRNFLVGVFLSSEPFGKVHKQLWKPLNYALHRFGMKAHGRELRPRPASLTF